MPRFNEIDVQDQYDTHPSGLYDIDLSRFSFLSQKIP
jgi:hypothetical protein